MWTSATRTQSQISNGPQLAQAPETIISINDPTVQAQSCQTLKSALLTFKAKEVWFNSSKTSCQTDYTQSKILVQMRPTCSRTMTLCWVMKAADVRIIHFATSRGSTNRVLYWAIEINLRILRVVADTTRSRPGTILSICAGLTEVTQVAVREIAAIIQTTSWKI